MATRKKQTFSDAELEAMQAAKSELGTGGMASKLAAARLSADAGVPVLLAAADQAAQALADASGGTGVAARAERLSSRRFWGRHAADARGQLVVDDGVCTLSPVPAHPPSVTLSLSAANFLLMVTGRASPLALFMRGKMRATGDIGLTMKLPTLFDIPRA